MSQKRPLEKHELVSLAVDDLRQKVKELVESVDALTEYLSEEDTDAESEEETSTAGGPSEPEEANRQKLVRWSSGQCGVTSGPDNVHRDIPSNSNRAEVGRSSHDDKRQQWIPPTRIDVGNRDQPPRTVTGHHGVPSTGKRNVGMVPTRAECASLRVRDGQLRDGSTEDQGRDKNHAQVPRGRSTVAAIPMGN